ncbi:DUF421 domain-containing protein [Halobacillus salinarum]|uniref:DUF421 domain-containing protein n=1 Tax=Halobacillus salinarum TaxID=2932257 RepID=A0ABY4EIB8_9BACI|nr:YetF domain-containing protein [Halobacillus salinarum]UOQ43879.1 DUF421 domain-containing protein [Halobacillus salinarum]
MPYFLKGILFYVFTLLLLRLGGKRTISNLTPGEVVVMIALGSLMVHPLKSHNIWITLFGGSIIIAGVLTVSIAEVHIPFLKKFIQGEPVVVIESGRILHQNLKKLKMTEEELRMQLRIHNVAYVEDVKTATFEVSGKLGVEFATTHYEELQALKQEVQRLSLLVDPEHKSEDYEEKTIEKESIFSNVKK